MEIIAFVLKTIENHIYRIGSYRTNANSWLRFLLKFFFHNWAIYLVILLTLIYMYDNYAHSFWKYLLILLNNILKDTPVIS